MLSFGFVAYDKGVAAEVKSTCRVSFAISSARVVRRLCSPLFQTFTGAAMGPWHDIKLIRRTTKK